MGRLMPIFGAMMLAFGTAQAADPVGGVALPASFGERPLAVSPVGPNCFVPRAPLFGRPEMLMRAPSAAFGEAWYAVTPAFGDCATIDNPYRARLVLFTRAEQDAHGRWVYSNGTFGCTVAMDTLSCNRPIACNAYNAQLCARP